MSKKAYLQAYRKRNLEKLRAYNTVWMRKKRAGLTTPRALKPPPLPPPKIDKELAKEILANF